MIKTSTNRSNGELAVRCMNETAQRFYNGTDPVAVYEYEAEDGKKMYAYECAEEYFEGYTFEELETSFEEQQKDIDELMAEWDDDNDE